MRKKTILSTISLIIILSALTLNCSFANQLDIDQGYTDGETAGTELGTIQGNSYFTSGKNNDWRSAVLSSSEIISLFDLNRDTTSYRNAFLSSFSSAFEEAFKTAFREANLAAALAQQEEDVVVLGLDDGVNVGSLFGAERGERDFFRRLSNNWEQSVLTEKQIIDYFNLSIENHEYRSNFIEGFMQSFADSYTIAFRASNAIHINEVFSTMHDSVHAKISFEGATVLSADNILSLEVPEGTVFRKAEFEIETLELPRFNPWDMYTVVTRAYSVNVLDENFVNLNRPITVSFPYFWNDRGGIFYKEDTKWTYSPSVIKENRIYTTIEDSVFWGSDFVVLIDNKYKPFSDTSWHWANDEIDYFLRRRFIINECEEYKFRPDDSMSRGEFIQLLDIVFTWENDFYSEVDITKFRDYMVLNEYKESFLKAVSKGIVIGCDDATLRPHMAISFQEVEWIIDRMFPRIGFRWEDVGNRLLLEKFHLITGLENKKSNISRAEVIYVVYQILKELS